MKVDFWDLLSVGAAVGAVVAGLTVTTLISVLAMCVGRIDFPPGFMSVVSLAPSYVSQYLFLKTKAQCPIRNFTSVYSTECRCKLYALRQEMLWQVVGQVSFTQFGTCTCTCVVLCKIYIRNNTILGWFIKKGHTPVLFFTRTFRFTQNGAYFVC